jgi:hypothetical protein
MTTNKEIKLVAEDVRKLLNGVSEEVKLLIIREAIQCCLEKDQDGQYVLYTGVFEHHD